MPRENILSVVLEAVFFPPGISIASLLLALLFTHPGKRLFFLIVGLCSLYLASMPLASDWLRGRLEVYPAVSLEHVAAEAIVVLGANRVRDALEYGGDTIACLGLERLRYAAWLQKKTGLPILASGGSVNDEAVPEAELMRSILKEFGVETRWMEGESRSTRENALFSSRLLKGSGIGEVLLVTHAWHMPRALEEFEKAGMRVIPAPTGILHPNREKDFTDWLPRASALQMTYFALHETIGRLWYRYQYMKARR